jgi:hypothetical protein
MLTLSGALVLVAVAGGARVVAGGAGSSPEAEPLLSAPRMTPPELRAQTIKRSVTVPESRAAPVPTVQTVQRWTRTWVNVRVGRSTQSDVVAVLEPGTTIQVADRQGPWWSVISSGRHIGFISNAVLTNDPGDVDVSVATPVISRAVGR